MHYYKHIITTLLLTIISAPLTAHDENVLHKHRYDPDTGNLARTDLYDPEACAFNVRIYHHPDESAQRAEKYDPSTGRNLRINFYRPLPYETLERSEEYDPKTGKILGRIFHRIDGTAFRADVYDTQTGAYTHTNHIDTDGETILKSTKKGPRDPDKPLP